ncbi:uncharacterized protein LOC134685039 isoform X2 [Mytilus trossulus]|uniref:uncharacterized protein LOC134685039 isoform X2 n=1 Tax=Mytilus trossulus TaxID=6551 RepID=UPI003005A5FF
MFSFGSRRLPQRSPCLQNFHKRRRRTRTSDRFIHVYAASSAETQNYQNYMRSDPHNLADVPDPYLIEEIDGVQFYRTTVPVVCESVKKSLMSSHKMKKAIKFREQPTTIILPENRNQLKLRGRKGRRLFDKREPNSFICREISSGEENEERKRKILDKLENDKENPLTRTEEERIHERAEFFSMSIKPDLKYLSLPEDFSHRDDPAYAASMCGQQLEYPLPKKRKSRNLYTDSCYVSYHSDDDPYDNSQGLPCGTRLYRPPDKLVELVADAITESPDGMLQVPQIYTVLMNKYPYFRYMDKSAVTSWRSSVRHALFQKWFRKVKFTTPEISSKGCFWCINTQVDYAEICAARTKKENTEDLDIDPNLPDNVIALLKEEEKELQKVVVKVEDAGLVSCSTVKVPAHLINQEADHDPILTTCFTTPKAGYYYGIHSGSVFPASTRKKAILPVSYMNRCLTPSLIGNRSLSPLSDSSNSCSSLVSPLLNSVKADTLGVDSQTSLGNSSINWAPKLPFDQFLDGPITPSQEFLPEKSEDILSNCHYLENDDIVRSTCSDLSSGKSSVYGDWEPGYELKENDLLQCLNENVNTSMNFKSEDNTEIGYIIPDGVKWGFIGMDEMPTAIFDKDVMASSPEYQSLSPESNPEI